MADVQNLRDLILRDASVRENPSRVTPLWQAGCVELNAEDRAILAFEGGWWLAAGLKIERIRVDLAISPSRFYKRLAELIDTPAALEHDPLLIRRLRRRRSSETMLNPPATGRQDH